MPFFFVGVIVEYLVSYPWDTCQRSSHMKVQHIWLSLSIDQRKREPCAIITIIPLPSALVATAATAASSLWATFVLSANHRDTGTLMRIGGIGNFGVGDWRHGCCNT